MNAMLLAAALLLAAPKYTRSVEVVIDCDGVPDTITIVMGGESFPAKRIATNRWSGESGAPRFDAESAPRVSARFGNRRTFCAKARPARKSGDRSQWVAEARLPCRQEIFATLSVDTGGAALVVPYVRVMPRDGVDGATTCEELKFSDIKRRGEIPAVAVDTEWLYLHLGDRGRLSYPFFHLEIAASTFGGKVRELRLDRKRIRTDYAIRAGRCPPNADVILEKFSLDPRLERVIVRQRP
jgi:hypothetical protein